MHKEKSRINPVRNTKFLRRENKISNGVNCLSFRKQEFLIKDVTDKINQAEGVQDKARYAHELQKEVDTLLSCPDFKKENMDCKNCRFIANLRKRTADLIIKAKKLE